LAEAEDEGAFRGNLIFDDSNAEICSVAILTGQARYSLSPKIIEVKYALLVTASGARIELTMTNQDDIMRGNRDWKSVTGKPKCIAIDGQSALIWPTPTEAGTLSLDVYRRPQYELESTDDEPEIPEHHHKHLIHWVEYRCYSNKDSEKYDPERAKVAEDLFTRRFGVRRDANVIRKQREKSSHSIRYGGL